MQETRKLSVGDWVEVRSKEEILKTLDANGQMDGMPFMPEMFRYCGKRFQVYKRAHKTCDYTTPYPYHTRRLDDTVHLETRCDGEAHGGCQAACLLYWKTAWLRPMSGDGKKTARAEFVNLSAKQEGIHADGRCEEAAVWTNTRHSTSHKNDPVYVCQATQVPYATKPLAG